MDYYVKLLILCALFYLLLIIRSILRRSYGKDNKLDYWIIVFMLDKELAFYLKVGRLFINMLIIFLILLFYGIFASERIPLDWLF